MFKTEPERQRELYNHLQFASVEDGLFGQFHGGQRFLWLRRFAGELVDAVLTFPLSLETI